MVGNHAPDAAWKSAVALKRALVFSAVLAAWGLVIFLVTVHAYLSVTYTR
jgi:hypothetical protein